jgi:hypothetical protein
MNSCRSAASHSRGAIGNGLIYLSCVVAYASIQCRDLLTEHADVPEQHCAELGNDVRETAVRMLELGGKPTDVK